MRELSKEDILDILKGCVILGTGGGGSIHEGIKLIEESESLGKKFFLVDINDVPDDAIIFTPYALGSITKTPKDELIQYQGLLESDEKPILKAVSRMEKYLDKEMHAAIACETGGFSTAIALYVAAMKGAYFLDADLAGRAVPKVQNSTYYINDLPVGPIIVANKFGEITIFENVIDDQRAENLLRSLSQVSNNFLAVVDHAFKMNKIRNAVIPGTISKALKLGRIYRLAKAKGIGKDLPQILAKAGDGIVVFKGFIRHFNWETSKGFTHGQFIANGTGTNENEELKIWFKNENLMSWLNNEPFVTLPDLICIFDSDINEPITNPNYRKNMNIVVVVYPAPVQFTSEKGLKAFGPKSFGFDVEYTPAIGRLKSLDIF